MHPANFPSSGLPAQYFPWSTVEFIGDGFEVVGAVRLETGALGEVLPQQPIRVLIRASLPWRVRISEVDSDVGVDAELSVFGHLLALVPGQGVSEMGWQINHCSSDKPGGRTRRREYLAGEPAT